MKCEFCRYAPIVEASGYQDECYNFEKYGTVWKDGKEGCTLHPQTLAKADREYSDYLGRMGTEMGLEMDFEMYGWDMDKTIEHLKHVIGYDFHVPPRVYHRHGKAFYKAYRNYWGNGKNEKADFEHLCKECFGIMEKDVSDDGWITYSLTEYGLDWLGRKIGVSIRESD